MSAFRRSHVILCACSGEGARADVKSLNPKSITRGGVVKRYEGVRMGYEVRLPARGAVTGCPESAEKREGLSPTFWRPQLLWRVRFALHWGYGEH
jgi:hypothetical protein